MTCAKEILQVMGVWTIRAMTNSGKLVVLTKVLLVPKLAITYILVLNPKDKKMQRRGRTARIYDHRHTYLNFALKENPVSDGPLNH